MSSCCVSDGGFVHSEFVPVVCVAAVGTAIGVAVLRQCARLSRGAHDDALPVMSLAGRRRRYSLSRHGGSAGVLAVRYAQIRQYQAFPGIRQDHPSRRNQRRDCRSPRNDAGKTMPAPSLTGARLRVRQICQGRFGVFGRWVDVRLPRINRRKIRDPAVASTGLPLSILALRAAPSLVPTIQTRRRGLLFRGLLRGFFRWCLLLGACCGLFLCSSHKGVLLRRVVHWPIHCITQLQYITDPIPGVERMLLP